MRGAPDTNGEDATMTEGQGGLRDIFPMTGSIDGHANEAHDAPSASTAISLDDLRRAFEDAMHLPKDPSQEIEGSVLSDKTAGPGSGSGDIRSEFDAVPLTPASILEAILFVGSPTQSGLPMRFLEDVLHGMSASDIEKTISDLNESYLQCGHPWQIVREGDLCSMQLLESMEGILDRLHSPPRDTSLSQNSIDCLSLIAYRPGITKGEMESLWGQNAGATLSYLMKKGLVRTEKDTETNGLRYFTTERFLEILGLHSLDDLPQGEEL